MAKGRKAKQKRTTGSRILSGDGLLGEIVGNALGQLVASGIERTADWGSQVGDANEDDLAAKVVRCLGSGGSQTVAQLLRSTRAGLTELLASIRSLKNAGLITDTNPHRLELTASGAELVELLKSDRSQL